MSTKVHVKRRGPLVLEGNFKVVDPDGVELPLVVGARAALCRCGASACKPFCDGSHNRIGFGADEQARERALMFYGVSHLDVSVTDLPRARRFYADAFGFTVKREGPGFCDIDTNTILLRLIETRTVEHRCALRLQVADVEQAFSRLVQLGARPLYEPLRTPQLELVGSVADPDGNAVSVWRNLSEDEYGFLPELPTEQPWNGEADTLLKSLLVGVPSLFRGLARRKVVAEAEELAAGRGVGREDVIRAYIRANAKITRGRVKKPLLAHGIDPEKYQADFEW